jgi:hypothetical protein
MYYFAGFFAKPPVPSPSALPPGAVWRNVEAPFLGVGVRLSGWVEDRPGELSPQEMASGLGIAAAEDWLYIEYFCWGGVLESVSGIGSRGGRAFGNISAGSERPWLNEGVVRTSYTTLMAEFGVAEADALSFPPFVHGYWDDAEPSAAPDGDERL